MCFGFFIYNLLLIQKELSNINPSACLSNAVFTYTLNYSAFCQLGVVATIGLVRDFLCTVFYLRCSIGLRDDIISHHAFCKEENSTFFILRTF